MEIYLYLERDTFFHKLNPITKIFGLILLFVAAMVFNHPYYVAIPFCLALLIILREGALINLRRIWLLLVLLGVFSAILWPLFLKGSKPLWEFSFVTIYQESLLYGLAMGLRLITLVTCGIAFLSCTKIEEFTAGLSMLGIPFQMSFALSLAFRLVPTFVATNTIVIEAQKSRGLDLESGGIIQRIRRHIPLFIPIFIYAIRNTDLLAMALESKGFGVRRDRTYLQEFRLGLRDYLTIAFLIMLDGVFIYLRLKGYGTVLPRV